MINITLNNNNNMFSSETISRDMSRNNSFLLSNPSNSISISNSNSSSLKHVCGDGQLSKSRDAMGCDLFLNQSPVVEQQNINTNINEQQQQQQQGAGCGSGLARYRSAPSSFLAALLDSTTNDNSSSGDESEALFSALMDGPPTNQQKMHYHMKQEESELRPGQMGYESAVSGGGGAVVGSYSVGMENHLHLRINNGNANNLVRQTSSPAGFFNGYGMIGEVENYRVHNHSKASSSAAVGMSNHINFSSAPSSSSRFMPSIPENVNETRNGHLGSGNSDPLFPQDSWINDTTPFNSTLKRNRDVFSSFRGLENQNIGETRKSPHGLVHHLSLPKTASEMAEVDKFLQVQNDTVPCQIRAKRGCATHPRSIAERMRRTRISEKMKKLQDLFPNMDKQTSTADMLDLAVQFIKDLQEQVETLAETKARCVCSKKPQQTAPNT